MRPPNRGGPTDCDGFSSVTTGGVAEGTPGLADGEEVLACWRVSRVLRHRHPFFQFFAPIQDDVDLPVWPLRSG